MSNKLPLGLEYMREYTTGEFRQALHEDERLALRDFEAAVVRLQANGQVPTVLLLELVTADTMLGFAGVFLQQLAAKAHQLGLVVVVDEVMTAMRCGQPFAFNYYPTSMFRPDYVTVGKGLLFGALLSVNVQSEIAQRVRRIGGLITCPVNAVLLRQSCRYLEVVKEQRLLSNVRALGTAIADRLQPAVDRYNGTSTHSSRAPAKGKGKGEAAVLRGVGAMWYTNLAFRGDTRKAILYNRLLPYLSLEPSQVAKQLVPAGLLCQSKDM
jgi:4-aminobutyrate aminotransferase-like enzyme